MPKPGPKQVLAAERLSKGYSSSRALPQNNNSNSGGSGSGAGAGGVDDEPPSALYRLVQPNGQVGYPGEVVYDDRGVPMGIIGMDGVPSFDLGMRLADQSAVAKHWRSKIEQSRRLRQTNTVALKPKVRARKR